MRIKVLTILTMLILSFILASCTVQDNPDPHLSIPVTGKEQTVQQPQNSPDISTHQLSGNEMSTNEQPLTIHLNEEQSNLSQPGSEPETETLESEPGVEIVNKEAVPALMQKLSEEDALQLVESKLDEEALRVSYLSLNGIDQWGNYVIRQASSASTIVMEWYYVNPDTSEITCEILEDYCLKEEENESDILTEALTAQQIKAKELSRRYAVTNLSEFGYVDGLTYVIYSHNDEDGNIVIWVYNPGSGMTDTVDWITVDVVKNQIVNSQMSSSVFEEEEQQVIGINRLLQDNKVFEVELNKYEICRGEFQKDFNGDGNIDLLQYGCVNDGFYVQSIVFEINGFTVEYTTGDYYNYAGITAVGIADVDNNDNFIEFYVTDGDTHSESKIFRFTDEGIQEIAHIGNGDIQATSGDGKIYYYGGNLYEVSDKKAFNSELVMSYYDVKLQDYVSTDQILGKTITTDREIIVYKNREYILYYPVENEYEYSEGKRVKILEEGETFEVVSLSESIDEGVEIRTKEGEIGWIGGFHLHWH